jgi:site-specific DNA recombinase
MKSIILARVSTEEQKEAGNSLPAQVARLEGYCKRKDFKVVKKYSFDESAYKNKRDEFDKILDYLKASKEKIAVCFDKVDRFSRNVFDKRVSYLYELAMQDRIELHFVSDNLVITPSISAAEKFHFGMNLGLAKYYSDAISDNVKRAYEQKWRNGEWTGKAPIGYINTEDEKGNKNIVPDTEKADFIVKLFNQYASGNHSMKTLAKMVYRIGLKSSKEKMLSTSMIEHTLKNPFYFGLMEIKGKTFPHKYQPLITHELYEKVQSVRLGWAKKPFQYAAKPFIFRGLIKCFVCGCTITPELKKGKYVYYSCTNHKGIHKKRTWVREEVLMEPIYKIFDQLQYPEAKIKEITESLNKLNASKVKFHKRSIEALRQEYDKLQKRADNMLDLLADQSITKDLYDKKFKEIKERQYEIESQMTNYTEADERYGIAVSQVFSLARRARPIFESSELAEKRQFLNFLFQNCVLNGKKLEFTIRKPFDAIAEYSQKETGLRR